MADSPGRCFGCESRDRKSTRLNSSHSQISYAVFCLKKKSRLEQAREIALQGERRVERGAQLLYLGAKGLDLFRCVLDLHFVASLRARHPFALLVDRVQD